jgi:hypothetical protein
MKALVSKLAFTVDAVIFVGIHFGGFLLDNMFVDS